MMLREGRLQGYRRLQRGPPAGLSQAATGAACRVIAGCNDRPGGHFIEMVRPSARKKKKNATGSRNGSRNGSSEGAAAADAAGPFDAGGRPRQVQRIHVGATRFV